MSSAAVVIGALRVNCFFVNDVRISLELALPRQEVLRRLYYVYRVKYSLDNRYKISDGFQVPFRVRHL